MYETIIENSYNTSYIIALLTSLFFKSTDLDNILNCIPDNNFCIYLQELIKQNFIHKIRKNISIYENEINEIRNIFNYINSIEISNLLDNLNIKTFYKTLNFNFNNEFTMNINKQNNLGSINNINLDYFELNIPEGEDSINLSNLLSIYINSNIRMNTYEYFFKKIPLLIPIYINRNEKKTKINIMKYIKMDQINENFQKNLSWKILSIICKSDDDSYYSIINNDDDWLCIDQKNIPTINSIDLSDEDIVYKISTESVFIFYNLL